MVTQTRVQNKKAHPGALVMTEAAAVKAGIKPAKPCKKKTTKEARIHELEEEVARLQHPNDPHPSKEPLVSVPPFILRGLALINLSQFIEDGNSANDVEPDPEGDNNTPLSGKRKRRSAQDQRYVTTRFGSQLYTHRVP